MSPEAQTDAGMLQLLRDAWASHGLEAVQGDTYQVLLSFPDVSRPNRLRLSHNETGAPLEAIELGSADHRPYVAYSASGTVEVGILLTAFSESRRICSLCGDAGTLGLREPPGASRCGRAARG